MNTLDLDTLTLAAGGHDPDDGEMCVMEAVAFIAGEEWTDSPECASPVIGAFMRSWNDALNDNDRQDLKRYIRRLVGSKGTPEQENLRGWMALDWLVRVHTPVWLRHAGLDEHADRLAGLAEIRPDTVQGVEPVLDAAREAALTAWDAAWDAARVAARETARDAAGAAAGAAARAAAWSVTWDTARVAARETAIAAAEAAARAAARVAAVDTARDAMWTAGRGAAWDLMHRELNRSAHELVNRMLAITESEPLNK